MKASKIYTAQEMRKMADCINNIKQSEMPSWKEGEIITGGDMCISADILRQAADEASRLEAVVKECEKQIPACRLEDCKCNPTDSGYCDENCHDHIIVHKAVTAILRVARGDAGKEER